MSTLEWRSCTAGAVTMHDFLSRLQSCSSEPVEGLTPLSGLQHLLATTAVYLVVVSTLCLRYKNRPASFAHTRSFVHVAALHNVLLCLLSLVMNIGAASAAAAVWRESGPAATVCTPSGPGTGAMSPRFQFWMYLFFASKFYELLDTVLLVLRGRPLTLLHVWHHASVMYEAWGWLEFGVTVAIYGMWFNTFVHIIMYAYYATALWKLPFPMKKGITTLQIVQFITGFLSLIPFTYLHITGSGCTGVIGLVISAAINGSYLLLFIRFFKNTYAAKPRKRFPALSKSMPGNKSD